MSRAGFVVLGGVLAMAGCRAAPEVAPPVIPPGAVESPAPSPVPWDPFVRARSWPSATAEWIPSAGHGPGGWSVQVRAEPEVLASYRGLAPGSLFAPGSVLAAFHRTASAEAGPVFAMVKDDDSGWTYVAADASGHLNRTADLELCERCHAEAPFDGLFGILAPTEAARASTADRGDDPAPTARDLALTGHSPLPAAPAPVPPGLPPSRGSR